MLSTIKTLLATLSGTVDPITGRIGLSREQIDVASAPYGAMNLKEQNDGLITPYTFDPKAPLLNIPEKTDCGFMAISGAGTSSISVDFQILLIDNNYI